MIRQELKILALFLFVFHASLLWAQSTAWFYGSIEEAAELADKEGKEVLILFTCGEG